MNGTPSQMLTRITAVSDLAVVSKKSIRSWPRAARTALMMP